MKQCFRVEKKAGESQNTIRQGREKASLRLGCELKKREEMLLEGCKASVEESRDRRSAGIDVGTLLARGWGDRAMVSEQIDNKTERAPSSRRCVSNRNKPRTMG